MSRRWDPELVPDGTGRTDRPDPDCPVERALLAVGGRWTTLVLRELMHGPLSFSALRAALPRISDKVLDERLRGLRAQGLVERRAVSGFPSRVTYLLSPAGQQLRPLLIELYRTGVRLSAAAGSPGMLGVDGVGEALGAGGDAHHDVEALARLDGAGVGEEAAQRLHFGQMAVEGGDDLGVQGGSPGMT
ncbi:hypothetical protein GCM10025331_37720 [Actinoplanes utahensis]|nr:hypothetical protein Aut01nite_45970 [Actinoplanes utahensis]